ncbi:MAG: UDP-N-acetylmuramate--L-alanine ligase [Candidatus Geothermincolia bacterium]
MEGRTHLIGIGGSGMSAIALALIQMGSHVSGSDLKASRNTEQLEALGAEIAIGHRPENIDGAALVVVSSAVRETNPELVAARAAGIQVVSRGAMLARLMDERRGVAIAGTHGKTTTTSMVAVILKEAGLAPTYLVGAELNDVGSNAEFGAGELLVAEADESDGSFLLLEPELALITNVEADHMDFYSDITQIKDFFGRFLARIRPGGRAVICGDDPLLAELAAQQQVPVTTYGGPGNDYAWEERSFDPTGSEFTVLENGRRMGRVRLNVPGEHNVANALGAIAMCRQLGVAFEAAAAALTSFSGVRRRFQRIANVAGVEIVDDYAHHPTEVAATLGAARLQQAARVVSIFQPHRYSRTAHLAAAFGAAFAGADLVLLTEVYAAGETPLPGISGKLLVDAVLDADPHKQVVYIPKRAEVGEVAARLVRAGDLVMVMGAGDISHCCLELA